MNVRIHKKSPVGLFCISGLCLKIFKCVPASKIPQTCINRNRSNGIKVKNLLEFCLEFSLITLKEI